MSENNNKPIHVFVTSNGTKQLKLTLSALVFLTHSKLWLS